jgi:hypothetical protein
LVNLTHTVDGITVSLYSYHTKPTELLALENDITRITGAVFRDEVENAFVKRGVGGDHPDRGRVRLVEGFVITDLLCGSGHVVIVGVGLLGIQWRIAWCGVVVDWNMG